MTRLKIKLLYWAAAFLFTLQTCQANKIPQFVPQGYHIDLYPDLDTKILKGMVIINIATYAEPTNIIELDADPSVSIQYKSVKVIELTKNPRNAENRTKYEITAVERVLFTPGTLKIHLNGKLLRDITYQVRIGFETTLRNDTEETEPFYLKTYVDKTQQLRKIFVMDLTRNGCYKAFPCFNQPAYKSWIAISVIRKSSFYAFTSAPLNHTESLTPDNSLVQDFFLSTPPLSMKSLALVVTNLVIPQPESLSASERSNEADNPIKYEVPAYVLKSETLQTVIKTLEEHLLIPFPPKNFNLLAYPKITGIPQINAYGLFVMTLRESSNEEIYIGRLILGVLRQWFNHMATPVSQRSIIEPMLTRFTYQMSSKILEKLNITRKYEYQRDSFEFMNFVLSEDLTILMNSSTSDIYSLFIFMMDKLYESKLLNEAAHMLLRKKEFKMYSEEDVWFMLSEASARLNKELERKNYENLREVYSSWKEYGFFPLVTVRRDYNSNQINVTQEPFLYGNDEFKLLEVQQNVSYYRPRMIPAVISHPNNYFTKNEFLGWMSNNNHSFHSKFMDSYDFIVFNPSYIGFFVTNYDQRNWQMILENFNSLPTPYKLQLLFDSMILANMGKLEYTFFLNMSLSLNANERDFPLWTTYHNIVTHLIRKLHGEVGRKFQEYVYRQMLTWFNKISTSHFNSYSKNEKEYIEKSKKEIKYHLTCLRSRAACFTLWEYEILMFEVRTGKSLTGEHNCAIIRGVSVPDWEIIANALFHALQNNATNQKEQVLRVLACTENSISFETLMNLVYLNFNDGFSIDQDDQELVLDVLMDNVDFKLLMPFVNKNFYVLKERLNDEVWTQLIRVLITVTKTATESKELFDFYNKYAGQFGIAHEIMREGLVIVSKRVRRDEEIYPVLDNWLNFAINKFEAFE
ncbi:thyrotropin-releasing hormone-degrading ectoenzyme-like [Planococcus citri]|uniref:thyrotropin-releasing hormone-degrading ectoenzyme-like n=1 Tax=Planococcus citri TaxID=170843 RepID=UPI0031F83E62